MGAEAAAAGAAAADACTEVGVSAAIEWLPSIRLVSCMIPESQSGASELASELVCCAGAAMSNAKAV